MKNNKKKMMTALLLIIIIGSLAGCAELLGALLPLDIEERLSTFSVIISNPERTPADILLNFGPSEDMEYYNSAKYESFWNDAFPLDYTYAFTVHDDDELENPTVDGYLTIEVDGLRVDSSSGELPTIYSFTMYEEASGNWLISAIYEDPDGDNEEIIRNIEF